MHHLVRTISEECSLVAVGNVVPATLPKLPHGDRNPARCHARQHIDQVAVLLPWYLLKRLQDIDFPHTTEPGAAPACAGALRLFTFNADVAATSDPPCAHSRRDS